MLDIIRVRQSTSLSLLNGMCLGAFYPIVRISRRCMHYIKSKLLFSDIGILDWWKNSNNYKKTWMKNACMQLVDVEYVVVRESFCNKVCLCWFNINHFFSLFTFFWIMHSRVSQRALNVSIYSDNWFNFRQLGGMLLWCRPNFASLHPKIEWN